MFEMESFAHLVFPGLVMRQLYKEASRPKWEHCETLNSSDQVSVVEYSAPVQLLLLLFELSCLSSDKPYGEIVPP